MAAGRTRATTCENSFRRPRWVQRAAVAGFARNASILPLTTRVAQRLNFGLPPVAGWPDAAGHGRRRSQGVEKANPGPSWSRKKAGDAEAISSSDAGSNRRCLYGSCRFRALARVRCNDAARSIWRHRTGSPDRSRQRRGRAPDLSGGTSIVVGAGSRRGEVVRRRHRPGWPRGCCPPGCVSRAAPLGPASTSRDLRVAQVCGRTERVSAKVDRSH